MKKELKNAGLHIAFLLALYGGSMMIEEGDVWLGSGFILFGYILCYVVRWLIEDLLKSKPEPKDSTYIPQDVKAKIIKSSEEFESLERSRKRFEAAGFKARKFYSKIELKFFIDMCLPVAIKPVGKTNKPLIDPFTSQNARRVCIDAIVESLIEK